MPRSWTFGRKLGAGFASAVALTILIGAVSIYALRTVVTAKDQVISVDAQNIRDAERLGVASARRVASVRGYLLAKQDSYLEELREYRESFLSVLARLRQRVADPEGRRLVEDIEGKEADYRTASERVIALRQDDAAMDVIVREFEEEVAPKRDVMNQAIGAFIAYAERILEQEKQAATEEASSAITLVVILAGIAVVLAAVMAWLLTRTLSRQIGSAVQHIQSSSSELQTAANQQASGSKEQSTAMNEITVTVQELLATARQIAESAQRVAKIAEDTASSAHAGDQTVQKADEAVVGIKRQVDLIVSHMLELGKKSQQIGGVLEIINELAEQTNILAINATIEAAGAGEPGKRFAAVADEIRKLADRVGGSTKEIRTLIEEVRAAVHTTVMATETGSKAVEAGTKQFADVAGVFKQIVTSVATTTEAAREIELSTKQQSTAVEQVNVATTNVSQATKESEASSLQIVQTASDLAKLSHDLAQLIQPQARA